MFSSVYFVLASSLCAADALPAYARLGAEGRLGEACATLASRAEREDETADPIVLQAYADIQLALGRLIEAEEGYRKAQRAIRQSRDALRIASCRNAGWLAFFQDRFSTAVACFNRVLEEPEASAAQRFESRLGKSLILLHLGCLGAVGQQLEMLAQTAEQAGAGGFADLAASLCYDARIQHELREAEPLRDHIYWRSAAQGVLPDTFGAIASAPSSASMPLLAQRLEYLAHLQRFAFGAKGHCERLDPHLKWAAASGLAEYHRSLCLEVSVAAVATQAPHTAETMLGHCRVGNGVAHQHKRWYLEYLYCLSKVRQQQGRGHESTELYGRYALASISHVRADSILMPAVTAEAASPAGAQPRADDVSARLPAKYRRAYRYLMEHLDQRDLSVRELAAQIGVTERALQAAFKTHLGLSPSELIRQRRMERIREELTREDGGATGVLDAAHKWGIQHRSTLINSYRKVFQEAPSETLAR